MTDDRVTSRASHRLPEENAVDSADPHEQASAILAESDLRTAQSDLAPDTAIEHRTSEEAAQ